MYFLLQQKLNFHSHQSCCKYPHLLSKILGLYSQNIKGTSQIKLTLKISPTNLGAVLQTFSRYDYTIDEIFSDDEISNQNQDRYEKSGGKAYETIMLWKMSLATFTNMFLVLIIQTIGMLCAIQSAEECQTHIG